MRSHLTNKLYTNKHRDWLSSPGVKNTLDNIHKDFIVVPIDKTTGNITLVLKRFCASDTYNRYLQQCRWLICK